MVEFKYKASIIIPTFNRVHFLKEAIESVLSQTYKNFEVIILDNHSDDETPNIISGYSDPRIRYIRHETNIGASANWTYGISAARGDYLSILGDDDKYTPEFLANRILEIEEDQNVVMVFGNYIIIDTKGNIIEEPTPSFVERKVLRENEFLLCALKTQCFIGSALYRSKDVKDVWSDVITGGMSGDNLLSILLAADFNNSAIWLPSQDYFYRHHSFQDSTSNQSKGIEHAILLAHSLKLRRCLKRHRPIVRKGAISYFNHLGRYSWDRGNNTDARTCFIKELQIDPFRVKTWLRLLRTFLWQVK